MAIAVSQELVRVQTGQPVANATDIAATNADGNASTVAAELAAVRDATPPEFNDSVLRADIDTNTANISGLTTRANNNTASATTNSAAITTLQTTTASNTATNTTQGATLTNLTGRIQTLENAPTSGGEGVSLAQVQQAITNAGHINATELNSAVSTAIANADHATTDQLNSTNARVTTNEQMLVTASQDIDANAGNIATIETTLTQHDSRINTNAADITNNGQRITSASALAGNAFGAASQANTTANAAQTRNDQQDIALTGHTTRLDALENADFEGITEANAQALITNNIDNILGDRTSQLVVENQKSWSVAVLGTTTTDELIDEAELPASVQSSIAGGAVGTLTLTVLAATSRYSGFAPSATLTTTINLTGGRDDVVNTVSLFLDGERHLYSIPLPAFSDLITSTATITTRGAGASGTVQIITARVSIKGSHETEYENFVDARTSTALTPFQIQLSQNTTHIADNQQHANENSTKIDALEHEVADINSDQALKIFRDATTLTESGTTTSTTAGTNFVMGLAVSTDPASEDRFLEIAGEVVHPPPGDLSITAHGANDFTADTYSIAGRTFFTPLTQTRALIGFTYRTDDDTDLLTVSGRPILRQEAGALHWQIPSASTTTTHTETITLRSDDNLYKIDVEEQGAGNQSEVISTHPYTLPGGQSFTLNFRALLNDNIVANVSVPIASTSAPTTTRTDGGLTYQYNYTYLSATKLSLSLILPAISGFQHRELDAWITYDQTTDIITPAGYTNEPVLAQSGHAPAITRRANKVSISIPVSGKPNLFINDALMSPIVAPFNLTANRATLALSPNSQYKQIIVATGNLILSQFNAGARILPDSDTDAIENFAGFITRTTTTAKNVVVDLPGGDQVRMVASSTGTNQTLISDSTGGWIPGTASSGGVSAFTKADANTDGDGNLTDNYSIPDTSALIYVAVSNVSGGETKNQLIPIPRILITTSATTWLADSHNPSTYDNTRAVEVSVRLVSANLIQISNGAISGGSIIGVFYS